MFERIVQIVLLLHVLLLPLYLYLTWNFNYWRKRGVRTALPLTIFGSFPSIVTRTRNLVYEIHNIYVRHSPHIRAVGVFVTRHPELLILDPKLAHEILETNFEAFQATAASEWVKRCKLDRFARYNANWCARDQWRDMRFIAANGLTDHKLQSSLATWRSGGRQLTEFVQAQLTFGSNTIETRDLVKRYAAHVLCQFLWGIDVDSFAPPRRLNDIVRALSKNSKHIQELRIFTLLSTLAPLVRNMWPCRLLFRKAEDLFTTLTSKALLQQQYGGDANCGSFLQYLLELRKRNGLSEDAMSGHMVAILLDAYEAISTTLIYTLFYLAKNMQIQQKLRAELMAAKEKGDISYAQLMALPYLDQCVHETLRLNTPMPYFRRICTSPTCIKVGALKTITLEPGMSVLIPCYSYHHDERLYSDPNIYRPERFDNAAQKKLMEQGDFLPFGAGPRTCIGINLSLLSIKFALVELIPQFLIYSCSLTQHQNNKSVNAFMLNLNKNLMLKFDQL